MRLSSFNDNQYLSDLIKKLCLQQRLSEEEKEYLLKFALYLALQFEKNHDINVVNFSYFLILKYSITYNDYRPLYDFSSMIGFYPTSNFILEKNKIQSLTIQDILFSKAIEINYKHPQEQYIQTQEQVSTYNNIMSQLHSTKELALIAPTSFGKSSIITDIIQQNLGKKIGIIVPSKSLIAQNFEKLKNKFSDEKILLHNEMFFPDDKSFIAIFTQERASRFFKKEKQYFDILIIDEAHNLFLCDEGFRNIVLAHVIRENLIQNPNVQVFYLSPFIADPQNLKILDTQPRIQEQRINFNVKSYDIHYFSKEGKIQYYDRFRNKFIDIKQWEFTEERVYQYIKQNAYDYKLSYIYLTNPKKIEEFALALSQQLEDKSQKEDIQTIVKVLEKHLHKDFYGIDTLKKGVVYLHGKLMSHIREYIESKITLQSSIRFIVANSVILEGINLPFECLFILNRRHLNRNRALNLMGRVNRLNDVYSPSNQDLRKLCPPVHYIDYKNSSRQSMRSLIEELSKKIKDEVQNPILQSAKIGDSQRQKRALEYESFLRNPPQDEVEYIMQYLIKNNLGIFYNKYENMTFQEVLYKVAQHIKEKIDLLKRYTKQTEEISLEGSALILVSKISEVFIKGLENYIDDSEFKRLIHDKTQKYYAYFFMLRHAKTSDRVIQTYQYFQTRIEKNPQDEVVPMYIGKGYGDIDYPTEKYPNPKKVYVNLKDKTNKELINLAIIKLEIEDNFVTYRLGKLVEMLFDFQAITQDEYNLFLYGSIQSKSIDLAKMGLSPYLIQRIEQGGLLSDISINKNGVLSSKSGFQKLMSELDDFEQFQLKKFIVDETKI